MQMLQMICVHKEEVVMVNRSVGAMVLSTILAMSASGVIAAGLSGLAVQGAVLNAALSDIRWLATSSVKPTSATTDTTGFVAGERVLLLDNDPPGGLGLKAGRGGTVLCSDANDGSGDILVSWDLWTDGKANTAACFNGLSCLYPANSATWIDLNTVRVGRLFKRCGTINQGLEGCVRFETDDGLYYNVVSSGALYATLSDKTGAFHFGDRVQIQGWLNTTPPAAGVIRICPQLDGDIFHPIFSTCPDSPGLPGPFTINLAGKPLQLVPDPNSTGPGYTYDGCTSITLELNFQAQLSVKVTPAVGVNGTWTGTVTPDIAGPGTVTVQICVHVEHLDISTLPAGNNVQVATIGLSVAPVM
jgi:hypothetical protein